MSRRDAFTLIEMLVVLAIGSIVIAVAYQVIHVMANAEKATDRASQRALTEARLSEALLRDLRSSFAVQRVSELEYVVKRHVLAGRAMEERAVTWKRVGAAKVTREMAGEGMQEFDFDGLLDPDEPAFRLRLERVPDGTFGPEDPAAPGAAEAIRGTSK